MNQNEIKIQKVRAGHYEVFYRDRLVGDIDKLSSSSWRSNVFWASGGQSTEHSHMYKAERRIRDSMTMLDIVQQYVIKLKRASNRLINISPDAKYYNTKGEEFHAYLEEKIRDLYQLAHKEGYDEGFEKGREEGYSQGWNDVNERW